LHFEFFLELKVDLRKTQTLLIGGFPELHKTQADGLNCVQADFPLKYLGIPHRTLAPINED